MIGNHRHSFIQPELFSLRKWYPISSTSFPAWRPGRKEIVPRCKVKRQPERKTQTENKCSLPFLCRVFYFLVRCCEIATGPLTSQPTSIPLFFPLFFFILPSLIFVFWSCFSCSQKRGSKASKEKERKKERRRRRSLKSGRDWSCCCSCGKSRWSQLAAFPLPQRLLFCPKKRARI